MVARARYAAFERVFRVEQDAKTGRWWAVGHQRGRKPYYLDKLGSRATDEEMQSALDKWAARHGSRALRMEEKVVERSAQAEFFGL